MADYAAKTLPDRCRDSSIALLDWQAGKESRHAVCHTGREGLARFLPLAYQVHGLQRSRADQ
ncbi:TPA: hypothetical protein EYP66_03320 [Candidatus Poribacteria bacterium]|nr:hypothetical protein [Candidatus Poribacteria bacterium]